MVHEPNRPLIGTRFTRKFLPRPEFDLPKLAKAVQRAITADEETDTPLPGEGKYVKVGRCYFCSRKDSDDARDGLALFRDRVRLTN